MSSLTITIADEHDAEALAGFLAVRPKFSTFLGSNAEWMAWAIADDVRKQIEKGLGEIARDAVVVPEGFITGEIGP